MRHLSRYQKFMWDAFAKGKRFKCVGTREWKDRDSRSHLGTIVDAVISQDATNYGKEGNNLYEKIPFKVAKDITIPVDVEIIPKNVEAVIYGEFRNQLSCTAEDIEVVSK